MSNVLPLTSKGRSGSAELVIGGAAIPPSADAVGDAAVDVLARVADGLVVTVASVVSPVPAAALVEFARIANRCGETGVTCADVKVASPKRTSDM